MRHCMTRLVIVGLTAACAIDPVAREASHESDHAQVNGAPFSAWSQPVNLGSPINVPGVTESNPAISRDELSLYFDSDRTDVGTMGARDIFVSRRACVTCPWQTPINLGGLINTPYVDGSPALSDDGHFLFFASHAPTSDCQIDPSNPPADPARPCLEDIYVSVRRDPTDDLGWSAPYRLGPEINTPLAENEPEFQRNAEQGGVDLYFTRVAVLNSPNSRTIYRARLVLHGVADGSRQEVVGSAEPVSELNLVNAGEFGMTMRSDGKELLFYTTAQPGGVGALDLMQATRQSISEPWSPPVNLGPPMNSTRADEAPSLSHDGRSLYFASARQGPPSRDIWVARRTIGGQ